MASYTLTGKLVQVGQTQEVSEKFKKREFVVETTEEINGVAYTNYAKLQLVQAKCDLLNNRRIGEEVTVSFNVKGNSYVDKKDGQTKYITNLDAWRIEAAGQQQHQGQQGGYSPAAARVVENAHSYGQNPQGGYQPAAYQAPAAGGYRPAAQAQAPNNYGPPSNNNFGGSNDVDDLPF